MSEEVRNCNDPICTDKCSIYFTIFYCMRLLKSSASLCRFSLLSWLALSKASIYYDLTSIIFRRLRAKAGTVDDLWIIVDDIKFDSDGEVSDASEIWSEYGDEIFPASQPKLFKWNPARKNVSEKHSQKERASKKRRSNSTKKFLAS